jgi:hypothetical protein
MDIAEEKCLGRFPLFFFEQTSVDLNTMDTSFCLLSHVAWLLATCPAAIFLDEKKNYIRL